jgi:hypothetical protein
MRNRQGRDEEGSMMRTLDIDQAIIEELTYLGACQVEDMVERLTEFTWNQVFSAIDRLIRDGTLMLQRPAPFGYEISITSGRNRPLVAEVSR